MVRAEMPRPAKSPETGTRAVARSQAAFLFQLDLRKRWHHYVQGAYQCLLAGFTLAPVRSCLAGEAYSCMWLRSRLRRIMAERPSLVSCVAQERYMISRGYCL